jgi:hypothetical protein
MFFKKKNKTEEKKIEVPKKERKDHIVYETQELDIGATSIEYELQDGRKFSSVVYGSVEQYVRHAYFDHEDHNVGSVRIYSSRDQAISEIRNLSIGDVILVDDIKNPMKTVIGRVISAEIGKTWEYKEKCEVARLVEEK